MFLSFKILNKPDFCLFYQNNNDKFGYVNILNIFFNILPKKCIILSNEILRIEKLEEKYGE